MILFGGIGLTLALVYWIAVGKVRSEIDEIISHEISELRESYQEEGHDHLVEHLLEHLVDAPSEQGYYLLDEVASLVKDAETRVTPKINEAIKELSGVDTFDSKKLKAPVLKGVEKFGKRILTGNMSKWPEKLETDGRSHTITISIAEQEKGSRPQFLRAHAVVLPNGERLLVARDVTDLVYTRNRMREALAGAGGIAILLAFSLAFFLNRSLLVRVRQMNVTVLRVMSGKQGERMPPSVEHDDFEELANHFNQMLDEKDRLLSQIRGITDDISHDLRTPLARIRRHIESTLALPMDDVEKDDILQKALEEADFILETFNALLFIAQVESGTLRDSMEPLGLSELVEGAVELYEPLAEEAGISFVLSLDPQIMIMGNQHLLAQAISNVIDNAIKYSSAADKIEVGTRTTSSDTILRIRDFGVGIPEEERERVLQRFVRLDTARHLPGTGLGLSFVAAVAKLHDAKLVLSDGHPGLEIAIHFNKMG